MKSIFISHDHTDTHWIRSIKKWASKGLLGPKVKIINVIEDVSPDGRNAIKAHLSPKLQGMSAIIVLVGDNTHNRPWVDYEVQFAKSNNKLLIGVRIPETTGGPPAAIKEFPLVVFNPNAIVKYL